LQKGGEMTHQGAHVVEISVEPDSRFDRSRLDKLPIPEDMLVAVIEREGETLIPHGCTRILAGDYLTVVAGPHCPDEELASFLEGASSPWL